MDIITHLARWLRTRSGRGSDWPAKLACEPVPLPGPWLAGIALGMHSREDTDARTPVGDLLDRFKYGGDRSLRDTLGRALARALAQESQFQGVYAAVHVPASSRRGQPEPARDLACAVARALRVRFFPRLIARTRPVAPQKDITSWHHKQANVRGAFRVRRPDLVKGRRLLLVDDVYDSGATLEEGWRALAEAGAGEVVVAAITKTRYRRED